MDRSIQVDQDIVDLLGTRFLGPDAGFGYRCTDVARGRSIDITYGKDGRSFVVWLEPRETGSEYFLQTRRFNVGYRGDPPDSNAMELLESLARRVREREDDWTGELADDAPGAADPRVIGGRLEIRVTDQCNEECPFCNTDDSAVNVILEPDRVTRAIHQARELGAWQVVFTGGEPTLRRELPGWVALARGLGLRVWIQTNGVIPGHRAFWERFRDPDGNVFLPDALLVSFHTRFPDRVEGITGVPGTLDRKIACVRTALELGIHVGLSYVVSTLNLEETGDFPAFMAATFGTDLELCLSVMAPTGRALENLSLMPLVRDAAPHVARALDESDRLGINALLLEVCGFPMCVLPDHLSHFDAYRPGRGEVDKPNDRVKWDFCRQCVLDGQCIGVWRRYVALHGSDGFSPVSESRITS